MGHQWKNKHGWTCRCVCFVLYCLELDLHGVWGGGVWIMTAFRAEVSRDLNLALTLGVPEGSSSSSLGFCIMCPGDACCPQGHWELGHVSAAAADAPIRPLCTGLFPWVWKAAPLKVPYLSCVPRILLGFYVDVRGTPCSPAWSHTLSLTRVACGPLSQLVPTWRPATIELTHSSVHPHWHPAQALSLWDAILNLGLPPLCGWIHVKKSHGLACSLAAGGVFDLDRSGGGGSWLPMFWLRHWGASSMCPGSDSSRPDAFIST